MNLQNNFFSVISKGFRKINRFYSHWLSQYQISPAQLEILCLLLKKEKISSHLIQQELELDSSSVTGSLNRLVKAGFVIKNKNQADQRFLSIELTPEGKRLAKTGEYLFTELDTKIFQTWSPQEKKEIFRLLDKTHLMMIES